MHWAIQDEEDGTEVPEWTSTHPSNDNRAVEINLEIEESSFPSISLFGIAGDGTSKPPPLAPGFATTDSDACPFLQNPLKKTG